MDSDKLEQELRSEVSAKEASGAYSEGSAGKMSRADLQKIARDGNLLRTYLDAMRENAFVDITDFEISERRSFMPGMLVRFKKFIWNMLRFYTYRLWSQQNEINGLLMSSLETMDNDAQDRIKELEQRVEALEKGQSRKDETGTESSQEAREVREE